MVRSLLSKVAEFDIILIDMIHKNNTLFDAMEHLLTIIGWDIIQFSIEINKIIINTIYIGRLTSCLKLYRHEHKLYNIIDITIYS